LVCVGILAVFGNSKHAYCVTKAAKLVLEEKSGGFPEHFAPALSAIKDSTGYKQEVRKPIEVLQPLRRQGFVVHQVKLVAFGSPRHGACDMAKCRGPRTAGQDEFPKGWQIGVVVRNGAIQAGKFGWVKGRTGRSQHSPEIEKVILYL
jgi:hypothetical protein